MKPRIWYAQAHGVCFAGIFVSAPQGLKMWHCKGDGEHAQGNTPAEAYAVWMRQNVFRRRFSEPAVGRMPARGWRALLGKVLEVRA